VIIICVGTLQVANSPISGAYWQRKSIGRIPVISYIIGARFLSQDFCRANDENNKERYKSHGSSVLTKNNTTLRRRKGIMTNFRCLLQQVVLKESCVYTECVQQLQLLEAVIPILELLMSIYIHHSVLCAAVQRECFILGCLFASLHATNGSDSVLNKCVMVHVWASVISSRVFRGVDNHPDHLYFLFFPSKKRTESIIK